MHVTWFLCDMLIYKDSLGYSKKQSLFIHVFIDWFTCLNILFSSLFNKLQSVPSLSFEMLNWHACSVHTAQMLKELPSPWFPQQSYCWTSGEIFFDLHGWQIRPSIPLNHFNSYVHRLIPLHLFLWKYNISQRCCALCFDHIHMLLLTGGNTLPVMELLPQKNDLCQDGSEHSLQ